MEGVTTGLVLLAVLVLFGVIVVAKSVALIPQASPISPATGSM